MKTSLIFSALIFSALISFAQNKYAVIVGINEYYETPGVKSPNYSLKGCMNDAISMKSLLINRFSFPKENVKTLVNAQATQKTFIAAMTEMLNKSKAGDVVVFYFCGHGVYTINPANEDDSVKAGYNQAICMSDLYSPNYECLVMDNTLKKLFNMFVGKQVTLTSIFDCCYSSNLSMVKDGLSFHNPYQKVDVESNKIAPKTIIDLRAFKLNQTLTITDKSIVSRPSETPNSRFANLAACSWQEKAVEVWDESGRPHGAFTKTLIDVFEKSKVDLPLSEIIARINNEIDVVQNLQQSPGFRYDTISRNKLNLVGLPLQKNIPALQTQILNSRPGLVIINKGTNDEIMVGNVFSSLDKKTNFTISKVYPDSALGATNATSIIKKDATFKLTDGYRISKPLIKIHIPSSKLSSVVYMEMFNKQILPYTKDKSYNDYFNFNYGTASTFLFTNQKNSGLEISKITKEKGFFVLMALPSDIANSVKAMLQKEQSIQLVSSPAEANFVLYVNYAAISNDNKTPKFVFSFREPLPSDINIKKQARIIFWADNISFPSLNLNNAQMANLKKGIRQISYSAIRSTGTHWINTYPRK
ncbi:caspase family protein [Pedobacter jamesrossensis]|uniref:Caspase family protein n=1 Tax=Pedobacter jamesrossensis TaxID=1908238 RepID=A0ABV8NH37_9SPHI